MWKRWRTSTRLILHSISGNGVRQQELGDATIIREAFRMEQVKAPAQAYH